MPESVAGNPGAAAATAATGDKLAVSAVVVTC